MPFWAGEIISAKLSTWEPPGHISPEDLDRVHKYQNIAIEGLQNFRALFSFEFLEVKQSLP